MVRKSVLVMLLLAFGLALAARETKMVFVSDDTVGNKKAKSRVVELESIGGEMKAIIAEALEEVEIEDSVEARMIVKKLRERRQKFDKGDMWRKRPYDAKDFCCGHPTAPFMLFKFTFAMIAGTVFLVMWIITLVVIAKGFSKIAKAIQEKQ